MEYIHDYLKKLLKKNNSYIGEDGDLLISKIVEDARLYNSELIKFLLNDKRCKDYFFEKIDDVTIFKSEDFRMCINDARFLGNSFTKYGNKIGLITDRTTEKIKKIKDDKELKKIFEDMKDNSLINHRPQIDYFENKSFENDEEFLGLDLKRKKDILLELLDKNMFYVPFSEIKDKTFKLSDDDIELSDDFYS